MGWKFYSVTSNKTRTAGEGDEEVYTVRWRKGWKRGEIGTREEGGREGREGG